MGKRTQKLSWRIPSKKNSRITTKSWRSFPSKQYGQWEKKKILELQNIPDDPISTCDFIHLLFTFPDKRKADLTNKAESVMDMLVKAWVLEDDNYSVVPRLILDYHWYSKENCWVDIEIYYGTNDYPFTHTAK